MQTNDSEDENEGPSIMWDKAVRKEMDAIPAVVQQEIQVSLEMALLGLQPAMKHEKLKSAGPGVIELKRNGSPAYRCMYVVDRKGNVVVLHVTSKTTQGQDKQLVKTTSQRRKRLLKSR